MTGKRDYYEVLGLQRGASEREIKQAYRRVALQHHPDRNPGDHTAEEKFKEAAEAYSVLSDPDKRHVYDQYGHDGLRGGPQGFSNFEDIFSSFGSIFEDFFGGGFGRREPGRRQQMRGDDLQMRLAITFQEAAQGVEKELLVERARDCSECGGSGARKGTSPETCPTCRGRGQIARSQGFFTIATACPHCRGQGRIVRELCNECEGEGRKGHRTTLSVKIPAGVDSGARLRLTGEGDGGRHGGPSGDLYVFLEVEPHPIFRRDGNDIVLDHTISVSQAALGAKVTVPTLDGEAQVSVPAGTQPGDTVRLRGKGFPALRGLGHGAQVVQLKVQIPTRLNRKEKKLFRDLADAHGEDVE